MPFEVADTQELVPEAQRATAFEGKDGKWRYEKAADPLRDEGQKAIDRMKEEVKAAEKAAKEAKARADVLERAEKARKEGTSEEQIKAQEDAKKAADALAENTTLKQQIENDKLRKAIRALGEGETPAVPFYLERLDDVTVDAYLLPLVGVTEQGTLFEKGSDGKPTGKSAADAFLALKPKRGFLFRGTGSSGGDSQQSNGDGGGSVYDPVAAGKAAAEAQKGDRAKNANAFR